VQLRNPSVNLKGIDVSHWQNSIDWKAVASDGVKFAYVKLSDGDNYIDPKSDENIIGAKAAGIKVGVYHFARFVDVTSAQKEAQWFINHVKDYDLDLPHVLDIEINHANLSKADLSKSILAWLEMVKEYGDVMIYTGDSFEHALLDESLKDIKLWVAHYGVDKPIDSPIWNSWEVFQYSSTGTVKGINGHVDMDEAVDGFFENVVKVQPKPETPPKKESVAKKVKKAIEKVIHPPKHYSISKGDNFWNLESKHYWEHGILQKLNPNVDPTKLRIGQMIRIPSDAVLKPNHKPKPKPVEHKAIVPYPGHPIQNGDKGIDVERIQRAVGAVVDGDFGSETERLVKGYQARHGLVVDGIVGQNTWNVMF
jgi:lysozyme